MKQSDPASSNNDPKIGILDSGVGGLSVLLEIRKLLPELAIDYIGDSAWCPYGNKSPEQIQERVFTLTKHLIKQGATIIVVLSVREEALVRGFVDKYKLWGGDKRPRPSPTDALRKESGESGGSFIPARLCEE